MEETFNSTVIEIAMDHSYELAIIEFCIKKGIHFLFLFLLIPISNGPSERF